MSQVELLDTHRRHTLHTFTVVRTSSRLRHGRARTTSRLREEFVPMDSVVARRLQQAEGAPTDVASHQMVTRCSGSSHSPSSGRTSKAA